MDNLNTALVKADQNTLGQYAIFNPNRDAVAALQRAVGNRIGPTDLNKITMGINGKWTVPSITGATEVDSVEGVVVFNHIWRGLYPQKYKKSEAGAVPQCTSSNGFFGVGDPGGECVPCPFNAWGSAGTFHKDGGRGKACKEFWFIYLWRANKRIPELLQIPATSLQYMQQYMMGLFDFTELDGLAIREGEDEVPMPILGVITRFTLQEVKGNVKVVPQVAGLLPEVVWPHMARASAFVGSMLTSQSRVAEQPSRPQPVESVIRHVVNQAAQQTEAELIEETRRPQPPSTPDPVPSRATVATMAAQAATTRAGYAPIPDPAPVPVAATTPRRPPSRRQVPEPVPTEPAPAEDDLIDLDF